MDGTVKYLLIHFAYPAFAQTTGGCRPSLYKVLTQDHTVCFAICASSAQVAIQKFIYPNPSGQSSSNPLIPGILVP